MCCALHEALKQKKLTQKDVADLLGIHYNTVSIKIHGKAGRSFTLEEASKIHKTWFQERDFRDLFLKSEPNNKFARGGRQSAEQVQAG